MTGCHPIFLGLPRLIWESKHWTDGERRVESALRYDAVNSRSIAPSIISAILACHEPAGALRSVDHKEQSRQTYPKLQCEKCSLAKKICQHADRPEFQHVQPQLSRPTHVTKCLPHLRFLRGQCKPNKFDQIQCLGDDVVAPCTRSTMFRHACRMIAPKICNARHGTWTGVSNRVTPV